MASTLDWDEFRLIKAIADAHSLVGAAEALNLNHSTVFRRLAAIENDVGARLFERSRAGYQPTEAGEEMIALAGSMAESILEFERRVAGRDAKPSGELRVTTVDSVAIGLLAPILSRFRAANPAVQVDLIIAEQTLNLSRRDADVAIRGANDPPESLVGRRVCAIRWAVYCAPAIANEFGGRVIAAAPWVGFSTAPTRAKRWTDEKIGPRRQVCSVNSVLAMAGLAVGGVGATVLPCFVGDQNPGLVRIGGVIPDLDVDLWLLTHADLRHSARVRAFIDFAGAELGYARDLIEGVAAVEAA
jgi:DNA-binding transcriptional LysR family regulator